jgi:hypothetical protein
MNSYAYNRITGVIQSQLEKGKLSAYFNSAGPSGRAVYGVGLRPLACCVPGFESHRGHGRLSIVSVVCVVRYRSLRQADQSSRGVLPTVVRRCV